MLVYIRDVKRGQMLEVEGRPKPNDRDRCRC